MVPAFALQAKSLILGCGALYLLQVFGAPSPSRCRLIILMSCLLASGDTSSSDTSRGRDIYAIFSATTEVQALTNLALQQVDRSLGSQVQYWKQVDLASASNSHPGKAHNFSPSDEVSLTNASWTPRTPGIHDPMSICFGNGAVMGLVLLND